MDVGVRLGLVLEPRPHRVHDDDPWLIEWELIAQLCMNDDRCHSPILEEKRQPSSGTVEIERQVRGASLEDSKNGDDQIQRAFEVKSDQRLRPNAYSAKIMRQAIGALIQQPVR
jgi:hypothetical protein